MTPVNRTASVLRQRLLDQRTSGGWWEGHLASSALSTATAVSALSLVRGPGVEQGLQWLAANQNADGGWGDTVISLSNISTTILCWCAFAISGSEDRFPAVVERARQWLTRAAGGVGAAELTRAILARYGEDRTFSVPILTVMAIAGKLGEGRAAWSDIPQLPFELAALPHQLFGVLQLPVVSYALPALIAIGQVRHRHSPSGNPLLRGLRDRVAPGTLQLLRAIQPSSGGYLEATPLTSFVMISLAAAGLSDHAVVQDGERFLRSSMRADGSWPIDTNLATWVTTLSVNALSPEPLKPVEQAPIRRWLLDQQYRVEHPYTHAAPGGWAWTPLPGGVPDADDTPGALLALRNLGPLDEESRQAGRRGVRWLLDLQNRDGGMPTFCKGWGRLPFDRSGADLTAHAISAWRAWAPDLDPASRAETEVALERAQAYLEDSQNTDGSWTPLWFGNEHSPGDANPVYGTSRVVMALAPERSAACERGVRWLLGAQNADGGWGGSPDAPSSIEETSLAVHALCEAGAAQAAIRRGVEWLSAATEEGSRTPASPIGLYFASLWYFEALYPLIFATGALLRARSVLTGINGG